MILCRIHRDPLHPRVKRTVTPKPRQRPVRFYESILSDILRQVRITHIAHNQIDDFVLVFQYQQIERALVAFLDSFDQLLIRRLI